MNNQLSALARQALFPACCLCLALPLGARAERLEETTILATGFPAGKDDTGLRVHVEDGAALNELGIWRLDDALLFSPGINVFSNGAHGAASSLFTRGTESDHTALFVDGVKLTDSRIFPFPAANILSGAGIQPGERLELLRGPQSARYGSDAIGGVLSLSLERGRHSGANRFWLESGSFATTHAGVSMQGRESDFSYNTFASWTQTSNDRPLNDHESFHAGLRLDYALSADTDIGLTLRVLNFETELPPLGMTPFARNKTENIIYSVFLEHRPADVWLSVLRFGGYESKFTNTGGFGDSDIDTRYRSADWSNRFIWNPNHETSAGINITWLDTSNSGAGIDPFAEQNESVYLQHRWFAEQCFDLLAGLRHDFYEGGKDHTTFRLAGSHWLGEQVKWHASLASGFRRPSVVDLFGFFGFGANPGLKSERSLGWDAGITWEISDTSWIDITYFHNEIEDLIASGLPPTFTATNIEQARTRGVELSHRASFLGERLHTRLAYTWLEAENLTSSNRLVRRPRHTLNADLHAEITDRLLLGTGLVWVADRLDFDPDTFARVDAGDYATVRIYGRYQLSDKLSITARVENLFDRQYAEVLGFPARGLGAFAGLNLQW